MDLYIIETLNGGDAILSGNDLVLADGYESIVYLSLFGGDKWFGNDLFFSNDSEKFNCTTEKVMNSIALNSAGRIAIENAIKNDLSYIKKEVPGTEIIVTVRIVSDDRIDILINITGDTIYKKWNPYSKPVPNTRVMHFGQFTSQFTVQFTRSDD